MKIQITENDIKAMTARVINEVAFRSSERNDALMNGADWEWDDFFTEEMPESDDEEFGKLLHWCEGKKPGASEEELIKFAGNVWAKKKGFKINLYGNVPEGAILCRERPNLAVVKSTAYYVLSEEDGGCVIYQLCNDPRFNPGRLIKCDGVYPEMPFASVDEAKQAMVEREAKFAKKPKKANMINLTYGPLGSTPDPSTGGRYYMEPGHYYGD